MVIGFTASGEAYELTEVHSLWSMRENGIDTWELAVRRDREEFTHKLKTAKETMINMRYVVKVVEYDV